MRLSKLEKLKKEVAAAEKKMPIKINIEELKTIFNDIGLERIERFDNCITLDEVMKLMTTEELKIVVDSEDIRLDK